MKLSKLMLSAFVAAFALVACNKDATTPEPSKTLKSVEINIENLIMSKAAAGGAITNGAAVQLNDLRIYLVDDSGAFYPSKTADGTADAQTYFVPSEESPIPTSASFHYVDRAVTHVIAVGNVGNTVYNTEADLNAAVLAVGDQQIATALKLYAKSELTGPDGTHDSDSQNGEIQQNQVYKADLTLMPRIARFEVDGFRVNFTEGAPAFNEIKVNQLAFTNYNPTTPFAFTAATLPTGNLVNAVANYTNETSVYKWFADHLDNGSTPAPTWSYYAETLTFNAPTAGGPVAKDFTTEQAFHFFPGVAVPMFLVHLTADGVPAYLYTKSIKNESGTAMTATDFKPGHVYRMSAGSENADDGSIPIDEEDIDPMDRCVDITVSVHKWVVNLVTPEF